MTIVGNDFRAPALPIAPKDHDPKYFNQFNNILRIYFNQLDTTITGLRARLPYGSFSDTTDQPVVAPDTPQLMTFNTTDVAYGVSIGSPTSRIVIGSDGVYNFQFSLQVESGTAASRLISIWPRVNGVNVPNSAGDITIKSNSDVLVPAWNYLLPMVAGDYFELVWACDGNNVSLSHHPAQTVPFVKPAIPSIILTVTQDSQ